jgi:hypothetical protein
MTAASPSPKSKMTPMMPAATAVPDTEPEVGTRREAADPSAVGAGLGSGAADAGFGFLVDLWRVVVLGRGAALGRWVVSRCRVMPSPKRSPDCRLCEVEVRCLGVERGVERRSVVVPPVCSRAESVGSAYSFPVGLSITTAA